MVNSRDNKHYLQKPQRKAEFFTPPNILKQKVGEGGLSEVILNRAQALIENNSSDFRPLGEMYLSNLHEGLVEAKYFKPEEHNSEEMFYRMIYPAMQLKGNAAMFHYPLVTKIADKLIQFLEVIKEPDSEALEIVTAYHTTLKAIIYGQITGDGGKEGRELAEALDDACMRYFEVAETNLKSDS